jgi:amino-acid N-acetyltransferase
MTPASFTEPQIVYRAALSGEAPLLFALIAAHLEEGHLLPRQLDELARHASRFVVATREARILGCAELAPLSRRVAEVRSLVVDRDARGLGIGRSLVQQLARRARLERFGSICAFTHEPRFFERLGFALVPHEAVPEKIARDCSVCPLLGRCGQQAVIASLSNHRFDAVTSDVSLSPRR